MLAILDSRTNQKPQTPPGPVAQHAAAVPYRQRADVPRVPRAAGQGMKIKNNEIINKPKDLSNLLYCTLST